MPSPILAMAQLANGENMEELDYELNIVVKQIESDKYDKGTTEWASNIIRRDNFFAQDEGGSLYVYKNGVYISNAERSINLAVIQIFASCNVRWTERKGIEVYKHIKIQAPKLLSKPDVNKINLRNGIYDVKEGKLLEHTPKYLTTVQLNVWYDPLATCPFWDKFIEAVFPAEEDGWISGYEIPAWLITPSNESQKSIVLLGSGSNGKSLYLDGITNFLGEENCCNISWQKLSDRFTSTLLIGKLANISPDLPNTRITSTSEFKCLTGGDYLAAEYKHGGQFKFQPFARCLFACNELPETTDTSDGFYRRILVIEFEKKFKDDPEKGRAIKERLTSKSEISGLFNACLAYLPLVLLNGLRVTEKMTQAIDEHRKENDPVAQWLEENTQEDVNDYIAKADLFNEYRKSGNTGKASKNAVAFGRAIKRYRPNIRPIQKRIDGFVVWCYSGIRLKTELEDMSWNEIEAEPVIEAELMETIEEVVDAEEGEL